MDPSDDQTQKKTAKQVLSELVARRKADLNAGSANTAKGGRRQLERAAASLSASKSKPALRK